MHRALFLLEMMGPLILPDQPRATQLKRGMGRRFLVKPFFCHPERSRIAVLCGNSAQSRDLAFPSYVIEFDLAEGTAD
jgi:hypothetical protein